MDQQSSRFVDHQWHRRRPPVGATFVSEVDGYAADPLRRGHLLRVCDPVPADGTGITSGDPVRINSSVTPATGNYSGVVSWTPTAAANPIRVRASPVPRSRSPVRPTDSTAIRHRTTPRPAMPRVISGSPACRPGTTRSAPPGQVAGSYGRAPTGDAAVDGGSGINPVLFRPRRCPFPLRASISLDKNSYRAGDAAQVTINCPIPPAVICMASRRSAILVVAVTTCGDWVPGGRVAGSRRHRAGRPDHHLASFRDRACHCGGRRDRQIFLDCISVHPGFEWTGAEMLSRPQ